MLYFVIEEIMINRFEIFTTQIAKISRNIRRIKHEEMKKYNLKSLHVSCLYYCFQNNGKLTATKLCEVCDEDKASVSRALEYLETNNYLKQVESNEKKYKRPILLTDKGLTVAKMITESINTVLEESSNGLSAQDREIFYQSLITISNNLQKIFIDYKHGKK